MKHYLDTVPPPLPLQALTSTGPNETPAQPLLQVPPPTQNPHVPGPFMMDNFPIKNVTLKAEIMWTLCAVMTHNSYQSNEGIGNLLSQMFPNSAIASKFLCGARKTAYMADLG